MATNSTSPEPKPFKIAVSDDLLSFIKQRVDTARLPPGLDLPKGEEWSFGIPHSTMSHLQEYWKTKYDWRAVEARINGHLKMFTFPISEGGENLTIHFVHHQSTHSNAIPLLFQHGWPGSFLEVDKIIDLLTNPEPGQQAYHVVAPSLPGFAFSDYPKGGEFNIQNMAAVNHKLMLALGYDKYIVQGGDWGSMIARIMAVDFPESCLGVHVNMLGTGPPSWWRHPFHLAYLVVWAMLQGKDSAFQRMLWWQREESGYFEIQGTKPLTLGYGLVDSPIGTLAWLRDKMEPLIDDDFTWGEEDAITWAMMYIIPGTSAHAQIYKNAKGKKLEDFKVVLGKMISNNVDFGASIFPKEVMAIPKWWASVTVASNIVFWKEHSIGGHFPSVERPSVLVKDITEFTGLMNPSRLAAVIKSGKLKK